MTTHFQRQTHDGPINIKNELVRKDLSVNCNSTNNREHLLSYFSFLRRPHASILGFQRILDICIGRTRRNRNRSDTSPEQLRSSLRQRRNFHHHPNHLQAPPYNLILPLSSQTCRRISCTCSTFSSVIFLSTF